eukprot:3096501-Prorocentrum_lima.AAC.1
MPTLPAAPVRRSHAIQVELVCQMMHIMQDQGRAVIMHCRDNLRHDLLPVRQHCETGGIHLCTVLSCTL